MSTAAEQWFVKSIGRGMQGLAALRLENTPAADIILATRDVWVSILWPTRAWDEEMDRDRIHQAFSAMMLEVTKWPAPADFLNTLKPRPKPAELPEPPLSPEQRERNKARIKEIIRDLGF